MPINKYVLYNSHPLFCITNWKDLYISAYMHCSSAAHVVNDTITV